MAHHHSCKPTDEVGEQNPFTIEAVYGVEQTDRPRDEQEGRGDAPLLIHPLGTEVERVTETGHSQWVKRIFEPSTAAAELRNDDNDHFGDSKEQARLRALQDMAEDPMKGWRPMITVNEAMVGALESLAEGAPNFRQLFDLVLSSAKASLYARMPFRPPPVLLIGPPGAGKSRAANLVAQCLGTVVEKVPITMQTGCGVLSGLDVSWRNPRLGTVARVLSGAKTASPILLLDEIDKSNPRSEYGQLLDPLHDLLEQDTARSFTDEYLRLPIAADAIIWLATANDVHLVPAPILDRMLVIEVTQPSEAEMGVILTTMIRAAMARWGGWFDHTTPITADTLKTLRSIHPRAARRAIDLAVGFAVAEGRPILLPEDVEHARNVTMSPRSAMKIGFF
ncbi:MAG: AAA family ATPase [Burkholderiales bacterium]|nr:AAA family ATPase [Burkholderiales bacterium]